MVSPFLFLAVATFVGADIGAPVLRDSAPYPQVFADNKNLLKYVGTYGPYSQRRGVGLDREVPLGCVVDQVVAVHRSGERLPASAEAESIVSAWNKVAPLQGNLTGSLEFANFWKPFVTNETGLLGFESATGPYSGLADNMRKGQEFNSRYGKLYNQTAKFPIWAADSSPATLDSARMFGLGFLGVNYTDLASVRVLSRNSSASPFNPCGKGSTQTSFCSFENLESPHWNYEQFERAAYRLNHENAAAGLNITAADVVGLMTTAAFELNVRGRSPWTAVFNSDEWIAFEYLRSAEAYCYDGPGAGNVKSRGVVFANATRSLFVKGPNASLPLAVAFAHETDILPLVAALGIDSPKSFDPSKVQYGAGYDVADIAPQGGYVVFERIRCDVTAQPCKNPPPPSPPAPTVYTTQVLLPVCTGAPQCVVAPVSNMTNAKNITTVTNVTNIYNILNVTNMLNVTNILNVTNVTNANNTTNISNTTNLSNTTSYYSVALICPVNGTGPCTLPDGTLWQCNLPGYNSTNCPVSGLSLIGRGKAVASSSLYSIRPTPTSPETSSVNAKARATKKTTSKKGKKTTSSTLKHKRAIATGGDSSGDAESSDVLGPESVVASIASAAGVNSMALASMASVVSAGISNAQPTKYIAYGSDEDYYCDFYNAVPGSETDDGRAFAHEFPNAFPEPIISEVYASSGFYSLNATAQQTGQENVFVRVIINDAVAPLPGCSDGPGGSCRLSKFDGAVQSIVDAANLTAECGAAATPVVVPFSATV